MDNSVYDSQSGTAWKAKGDVTRDKSRQAPGTELDSHDMQVPMAPTEADLTCDKRLQALFNNSLYKKTMSGPASITVSGSSTTNFTSMSSIAAPRCPLVANTDNLSLVPMRMIPMTKKDFTDRHLREKYRYYRLFVRNNRKAELSEWPEGVTEKTQWKGRMNEIGREVRFLGRKKYKKAVQDTINEQGLTMNCAQSPRSWTDHLGALFNPSEYCDERRDLVYWIQFWLLRYANNAWIHKQETTWCSERYGVEIVYDKDWERMMAIVTLMFQNMESHFCSL